jgi:hypothetical protein
LDGVRWQEVFVGTDDTRARGKVASSSAPRLWPNVYRKLAERGVALGGGDVAISASGPDFVSLPGYTEIFTGRFPSSCKNNDCPRTTEPTLVDEVVRAGGDAAVVASWERLERAATSNPGGAFITTGRHAGTWSAFGALTDRVRAHERARPEPGGGDFRPDRLTADIGLAVLRERQPRFLAIGLGEPDEYAHHDDYPGYLRSLRAADAFLGELFLALDAMGERGRRTAVFVTTDHGRAKDFCGHGGWAGESARSWLLAFGAGIHTRGVTQLAEPRRLADIAPTIRHLLGLPHDPSPRAGTLIPELRPPLLALD